MDQTKAFFTNPVKMVANEIPLKLKLFGATVHGYGKTFFIALNRSSMTLIYPQRFYGM